MHVIKKQVIELKLNKGLNGFHMQHQVSEYYWKQIVPLLENVFDAYSNDNEVIQFDKLEIDLGVISETELEKSKWNESFLNKIKERIKESIIAYSVKERFTKEQKTISVYHQWIFYMQHGYLHWNTFEVNSKWYETVLQILAADFIQVSALRQIIRNEKDTRARIVLQHSDDFLTKLSEVFTAQNQKKLQASIDEIIIVLKLMGTIKKTQIPNEQRIKELLWEQVIYISAVVEQKLTTERIISIILNTYKEEFKDIPNFKKELFSEIKIISSPLRQLLTAIRSNVKDEIVQKDDRTEKNDFKKEKYKTKAKSTKSKKVGNESETSESINKLEAEGEIENTAVKIMDNKPEDNTQKPLTPSEILELQSITENLQIPSENAQEFSLTKEIADDGAFLHYAGLVLLHPFLNNLFKRLQIIEEQHFINIKAQQKAIYLLYYLATGNTVADEYELAIPKLLCAYSLHIPVQKEIQLTPQELEEADSMMEACIQQWDKIKNSSLNGLREGFLQRKGKLSFKDDSPYLQIETSGIDVLLDYLPWNISIIKLPWLKEIIRVEWR